MKVYIDEQLFNLPAADLYKKYFLEYTHDDIIYINEADLERRYKATRLLFDYVCNSFLMSTGDLAEEENFEFASEVADINRRSSSVDNMQVYCYQTGKILKAIELMNKFMVELLSLYEHILNMNKQTVGSR